MITNRSRTKFEHLCVALLLLCGFPNFSWAAQTAESSYLGWETVALSNSLIELHAAPQLGGRIIQFSLDGFDYLWVNDQLKGQTPPATGLGPDGDWLNYGGEKVWPAPQGWDNDQQWQGPPDAVLDGGKYRHTAGSPRSGIAQITMTSAKNATAGIQFKRQITVRDHSTQVGFDLTMTNVDTKPRRWGIWQVTQHDARSRDGNGFEKRLFAYCSRNPTSLFTDGYRVMFGLANNPSFSLDRDHNLVQVHYQRKVGKIGVDCSGQWLAVVNETTGNVFVTRFTFFPDKPYPDRTSVQFWTHGVGQFYTGNELNELTDDPVKTPAFLESEVLSPYAELQPGQSCKFHVDWFATCIKPARVIAARVIAAPVTATRIKPAYPIIACTSAGVTCQQLSATIQDGKLKLAGQVGVFHDGKLGMIFKDGDGRQIGQTGGTLHVSPQRPVSLKPLANMTHAPAGTTSVILVLYDQNGQIIDELGRCGVSEQGPSVAFRSAKVAPEALLSRSERRLYDRS